MKNKVIKIDERYAVEKLKRYIDECDADEVARLLGDTFGGECFPDETGKPEYKFFPNEYYGGEFN